MPHGYKARSRPFPVQPLRLLPRRLSHLSPRPCGAGFPARPFRVIEAPCRGKIPDPGGQPFPRPLPWLSRMRGRLPGRGKTGARDTCRKATTCFPSACRKPPRMVVAVRFRKGDPQPRQTQISPKIAAVPPPHRAFEPCHPFPESRVFGQAA